MAQASAEKLEHTGPAEKERVAAKRAVGKYARAAFAKRKRNKAVCPEYQIVRKERVKVSERRTLARERRRSEREYGEERVDYTVKEGGLQGGERGQARRASLSRRKHERVSGRKNSPGKSGESWFHSKPGQT